MQGEAKVDCVAEWVPEVTVWCGRYGEVCDERDGCELRYDFLVGLGSLEFGFNGKSIRVDVIYRRQLCA